jgi:hypothetical protein
MLLRLVTLCIACHAVSGALRVATITWNMADEDKATQPILTAFQRMIAGLITDDNPPTLISVMLQESKLSATERAKIVGLFPQDYKEIRHKSRCDGVFGHGCNEVFVISNDATVGHGTLTINKRLLYNEKSTILVWIDYHGRYLCFVGSHLAPGDSDDLTGASRTDPMKVTMQHVLDANINSKKKIHNDNTVVKCGETFWGGDFNLRTAPWTKGELHPHFVGRNLDTLQTYYESIDATGLIVSPVTAFPAFVRSKFELSAVAPTSTDGNGNKFVHPPFVIPPTFSKSKTKHCPANLRAGARLVEATVGDKRQACFPTARGGNCPANNPTHICMSATRPLTWTDFFLFRDYDGHRTQVETYGIYPGPTPSDHFPVFARFVLSDIDADDDE